MQEMQEMRVWSLGQKESMEEGKTTHSCILAWRTPWTEEPSGLWSMGSQSQTQLKQLSTHVCKVLSSLVAQTVKRLPAIQGTRVWPLGWDPWRRQWHPTPVLLPGKLHAEEPGRLQSMALQRVRHDWTTSFSLSCKVWAQSRWECRLAYNEMGLWTEGRLDRWQSPWYDKIHGVTEK